MFRTRYEVQSLQPRSYANNSPFHWVSLTLLAEYSLATKYAIQLRGEFHLKEMVYVVQNRLPEFYAQLRNGTSCFPSENVDPSFYWGPLKILYIRPTS